MDRNLKILVVIVAILILVAFVVIFITSPQFKWQFLSAVSHTQQAPATGAGGGSGGAA